MTAPLAEVGGRRVVLPYPHDGSSTRYWYGCRCDACRAYHARVVRDRRRRRAEGRDSRFDRFPIEPTVALLTEMHDSGMTWRQIAEACGLPQRDVLRLRRGANAFVSRKVADRVAAGHREMSMLSDPASYGAFTVDGRFVRWMVFAMMARGWPLSTIREESGATCSFLYLPDDRRVTVETRDRVAALFARRGDVWGPNRMAAVRAWRRGWFPSDCYDWDMEVPDLRPIPGSLHPDLVVEAATFPSGLRGGRERVLRDMASWGQWPSERCARASFVVWSRAMGYGSGSDAAACASSRHDHSLPVVWR